MISQMLFIVILLGFVDMLFVWASVRRLVQDQAPIVVAFPSRSLRDLIKVLVAAPLLATAVHLVVSYAIGPRGDMYASMAQAIYFLGWWAAATIMVFVVVVSLRAGTKVPASAILGIVLTVAVLGTFTSAARFAETFSVDGFDRAIIVGLALVLMGYTVLRRLWRGRSTK